ncbi:MAG: DUF3106 domain-containing protein [Polaromonas sp.]
MARFKGWDKALLMTGVLGCVLPGLAQTQNPALPAASAPTKTKPAPGVSWAELTPTQQQALAPLATSWNTSMSESQKRKWLEISKNYSALSPEGQATLTSRMNEWVALSPQQRAQARLNFGKTKELSRQLTPEEKKATWEAYQALSPEEKRKLAEKGSPKPTGAATAVKPVSPQKLAIVPAHGGKLAPASAPKIIPSPQPSAAKTPEVPTQPASATSAATSSAPVVDMH